MYFLSQFQASWFLSPSHTGLFKCDVVKQRLYFFSLTTERFFCCLCVWEKKRHLPQLHIVVHRGDHGLQDPQGLWVICQGISVSSGKQKHRRPVIIRCPMLIAIRFFKLAQTQEDDIWGGGKKGPEESNMLLPWSSAGKVSLSKIKKRQKSN